MVYDYTKIEKQPTPEEGDRVGAKIVDIESGVLRDFVRPEYLPSWAEDKNDAASVEVAGEKTAIRITAKTKSGITKRRIFHYPPNMMVSPRSNLAKWRKVYGEYPHIGQEVELVADKDGYYDFLV